MTIVWLQLMVPSMQAHSTQEPFVHVSIFFRSIPLISWHIGSSNLSQITKLPFVQLHFDWGLSSHVSPGFLVFPLLSLQAITMGGWKTEHTINWEGVQLHVSSGFGFHVSPILYSDPLKLLQYPGGAVVKKLKWTVCFILQQYMCPTTGLRKTNNSC